MNLAVKLVQGGLMVSALGLVAILASGARWPQPPRNPPTCGKGVSSEERRPGGAGSLATAGLLVAVGQREGAGAGDSEACEPHPGGQSATEMANASAPAIRLGHPDVLPVFDGGEENEVTVVHHPLPLPCMAGGDETPPSCTVTVASVSRAGPTRPLVPLPALGQRQRLLPFAGTFEVAVDEAGSVMLPERMRLQLGEPLPPVLYVRPGPDESLWLYPPASFQRLADRLTQSLDADRAEVYRRLLHAQAEAAGLSPDGRLVLPASLARLFDLDGEAVIIGVDDRFELWQGKRWQQYLERR